MSEAYKIVLTAGLTALGGVIVLVAGQLVLKSVIEPIQEFFRLKGEIAESLIFFANANANLDDYYLGGLENVDSLPEPRRVVVTERYRELLKSHWKRADDGSIKLRQQAGSLLAKASIIPCYRVWSFLRILPGKDKVSVSASNLVGLANSMHSDGNTTQRITEIAKLLNLTAVKIHFGV